MTDFWHPFADMAAIESGGALTIVRGEGTRVWDADGRSYLDATAALWYCNIGWGRGEIGEAVARQMAELPSYSTFGDLTNEPIEALASRVAELAPVPGSKVFFTSGGSDSIDTTTKMARRYWQLRDQPERTILIRREHAYHGMHTAGTSLAGIPANATGHGDLITDVIQVPWNDAGALATAIAEAGPERVAAFFCEPVIGAGGVYPPPDGYLAEVREICRETGVLFVSDEVITGFARCGDWFAAARFDLQPDIVICAKGITSGYLPMGAVIAAPSVADVFWAPGVGMWRHGYTYSGHAAVAAGALVNLDIMEREDLCGRARKLETVLLDALAPLADHPLVGEVRGGTGVLAAVVCSAEAQEADPMVGMKLGMACRAAGLLTRPLTGGAVAVSPALTIDEGEIEEIAAGFRTGLDALAG